MKILVYGAGVIGSLYAAKLKASGQDTSILARGQRFDEIRKYGIVLEDGKSNHRTVTEINVVNDLKQDDTYDLIMVIMPKNCVGQILPVLAENNCMANVLFMCNNAAGPDELIRALGRGRVLLGFPGAGGVRKGHVIRYRIVSERQQPTMLGELDGAPSGRVKVITELLKSAGFPTSICPNMDAWLKTHVAEISPMALAVLGTDGDHKKTANDKVMLIRMIHAIREGYSVLKDLGTPVTPSSHKIFNWMPISILRKIMRKMLMSESMADLIGHASAAKDEMGLLAEEFSELVKRTKIQTPALDELHAIIGNKSS
jgi:2-dehydropantoate 2-reductase